MVMISELNPEVIKICRPLIIDENVLKLCTKKLSDHLDVSLQEEHKDKLPVKSRLTHIEGFPTGQEIGNAIGVDFCGKIFRVGYFNLRGDRVSTTMSKLYEIPDQRLMGNGSKLTEYITKCIANFMDTTVIRDNKVVLAVAFGFPMEQDSLQHAELTQWTKGFRCQDLVGSDFFMHLKVALKKCRQTKNLYLIGFISDATACLLSGLYKDPGTRIGLVAGADTNICFIEKCENIPHLSGNSGMRSRTALDVEIRRFGDDGCLDFIKSEFDFLIDSASDQPGQFTLNKLISASYMGELVRVCLVKLAKMGTILDGKVTEQLSTKGNLSCEEISAMEMEDERKLSFCKRVLYKLGYKEVTNSDCIQVRFICRCFARRSSCLMSTVLAAFINRIESREVKIMVDGPLIRDFPNYRYHLEKKVNLLKRPDAKFAINLTNKDDIGMGASLVAIIYKEAVIKLEDKHRALPEFNVPKCGYKQTGVPCNNCKCPPKELCYAPHTPLAIENSSKKPAEMKRKNMSFTCVS